jgi:hypothetical protein
MTEYVVKVGFWLPAFDSVTVEADGDAEAIEKAKVAATAAMALTAHPEHVDFDERREGVIAFIDRITPAGRQAVVEDVAFDEDRIRPDGATACADEETQPPSRRLRLLRARPCRGRGRIGFPRHRHRRNAGRRSGCRGRRRQLPGGSDRRCGRWPGLALLAVRVLMIAIASASHHLVGRLFSCGPPRRP